MSVGHLNNIIYPANIYQHAFNLFRVIVSECGLPNTGDVCSLFLYYLISVINFRSMTTHSPAPFLLYFIESARVLISKIQFK